MSKNDDGPTISMRLEKGRLVPTSQFDLELLDRWHEGALLNVEVTRPSVRPLERKYFAMLSYLIRQADTPWSNTDTAHEAIKLATGFVTPLKKRDSREWGSRSRHISSFTDTELSEFFELFCAIVRQRFGIEPDDLARESPDIGTESSSGSAVNSVEPDDGPGAHPIPVGAGEPIHRSPPAGLSADGEPEAGDTLESTPRDVSSARGPNLRPEEWDWVRQTARMLVAATEPGGDVGVVDRQVMAIKEITPTSITPEAKEVAQLIYRHCRAVTKGDRPLDAKWVAYMARCNPSNLRAN